MSDDRDLLTLKTIPSSVGWKQAAAFSSRCSIELVPEICSIMADRCRSQANAPPWLNARATRR